ncbi:NADH-quinone oxidoreductase subunit K [Rhodobacteraceae bacterium 2376]|uniref:NADH-quinone oxidoreductase subunit K n=1 Tax=Rhabdonatronobacter sediminivivens TaxID=2743469 RepID=A0A7Z0KZM7_9RHOB|nr:NADH-quinone oxidoreductase subunit K [Rhabdonatronobacter sediminivivens]NYS25656.1 NADH-quinone oxidoreductase subunit K [Rhabdonatronobacter sediminivivens]
MTPALIYGLTGIVVFGIGLFGALCVRDRLRRLLALNLCGMGAAFVLVAGAWRMPPDSADPVPHALVITGIVVLVSATAVALALIRRLHTLESAPEEIPEDTPE